MVDYKFSLPAALVALVLFGSAALAAPPGKLVPFPEDEQAPPPAAKPDKPAPPKSNFQPRFRAPAVKQVQHVEPVAATETAKPAAEGEPASLELPATTPAAATSNIGNLTGRAAMEAAAAKIKTASTESDFTDVIALCEGGLKGDMSPAFQAYAKQLMGWSYNRRGEARAKEGKDQEALADFEAAVNANAAWRSIHNRGVSYAALGRVDEALADFDKVIELNQQYPNVFFNRGEIRYQQGDFPGAIRDYTEALKLGKPDSMTYASRAHAFYRIQRFGDALRDYSEAIRLDAANAAAYIDRGDTYSDLGQYGEAAKDYQMAVKVAPKMGRAFQAAAWLMATCPDQHYRNDKLAVEAAERAIKLDGETYRTLSTLAAAQASGNLFKEAQATQEKAIAAATKEEMLTGEKMMSLYQRELAYRDRPFTATTPIEELDEVQQAAASEPIEPVGPPNGNRRPMNNQVRQAQAIAPIQQGNARQGNSRQGNGRAGSNFSGNVRQAQAIQPQGNRQQGGQMQGNPMRGQAPRTLPQNQNQKMTPQQRQQMQQQRARQLRAELEQGRAQNSPPQGSQQEMLQPQTARANALFK